MTDKNDQSSITLYSKPPKEVSFVPPKYLYKSYDGMEKDIADDVFSILYHQNKKKLEKKGPVDDVKDQVVLAKLTAEAMVEAGSHLDGLNDASKRASALNLWRTYKNNYHNMTKEEYGSTTEWLLGKLQTKKSLGEASNICFLLEHFFPLLESLNVNPEELLGLSDNWAKTRASIPYMRHITKEMRECADPILESIEKEKTKLRKLSFELETTEPGEEADKIKEEIETISDNLNILAKEQKKVYEDASKEFTKKVGKVLKSIGDPNIEANRGPNSISSVLFNGKKDPVLFDGLKTTLPGKAIYYIVVDEDYERAFESATRNIVTWGDTDAKVIVGEVNKLFKKGE